MTQEQEKKALKRTCFELGLSEQEAKQEQVLEAKRMLAERHEKWLKYLDQAREQTPGANEEYHIMVADSLAIQNWVIPPHWRATVWCKECGPMPSMGPFNKEIPKVESCPWCWTDAGNFYRDNPELAPKPSPSLKNAI